MLPAQRRFARLGGVHNKGFNQLLRQLKSQNSIQYSVLNFAAGNLGQRKKGEYIFLKV